eukprot:c43600_g1_i1 orf=467-1294(+)
MVTSSISPDCSTAKSAVSVERETESGWTDYFSWADDPRDSEDLASGADSGSTQRRLLPDLQASSGSSDLTAIDARLAKEARECLIADHIAGSGGACRTRETALQGHVERQFLKVREVHTKFVHSFGGQDDVSCIVAATSVASVASNGPDFSPLPTSYSVKKSPSRSMDRHSKLKSYSQMPALRLDMANRSRVCCKRVQAAPALDDSALQDTCSKTTRIVMQSKFHRSPSSSSAAHPPLISSGLQWSGAAACSPASHEESRVQQEKVEGNITSFGI